MGLDGGELRLGGLRYAATHVDAAVLDDACRGFHRAHKHRSAKRTLYVTQIIALLSLLGGLCAACLYALDSTLTAFRVAAFALFSAAIILRLFAAASLKQMLSRLAAPARFPTYTILCPLYREANGVADLVAALERLDYPGFLDQQHPRAA
jgi:hypothetical protein